MTQSLRQAGFARDTSLHTVAKALGLPLEEVRQRAGLDPAALALDDAALDRPFTFPDRFVPRGGDGAALGLGSLSQLSRTDGPGSRNTAVGGLLRAKLLAQTPSGTRIPLPADPTAFEHEGKWRQALRRALTDGGVNTIERVLELADRLGLRGAVPDQDADTALHALLQELAARRSNGDVVRALEAATEQPIHGIALDAPVAVDVNALPVDASRFEHGGAFRKAVREALLAQGVQTTSLARALAARLDVAHDVAGETPSALLYATLSTLSSRVGGNPERLLAELRRALIEPLDARALQEPVPAHALERLSAATSHPEVLEALLTAVGTPARLEAIAERFGISDELPSGPERHAPRAYATALIDGLTSTSAPTLPALKAALLEALRDG